MLSLAFMCILFASVSAEEIILSADSKNSFSVANNVSYGSEFEIKVQVKTPSYLRYSIKNL